MLRGRTGVVVAYLAALAILAAGVVVLVQDRRDSRDPFGAVDSVRPTAEMPFAVSLSVPGTGRTTLGTSLSVAVQGYSEHPIRSVELIDSGSLVASGSPGPSGSTVLPYPSIHLGERLVYARATDESGAVATSPPVRVFVSSPLRRGRFGVPVSVQKGESPQQLADRLGVDRDDVYVSPGEDPDDRPSDSTDGELPAHRTVFVAVVADPTAKPPERITTFTAPVDAFAASGHDGITIPGLQVTIADCSVTLKAPSVGAVTFLEGTASGWVELTDGPKSSVTLDQVAPGTHVYAIRDGQQQSPGSAVVVPGSCGSGMGWTGDARIIDGQLHLDAPPGGLVYLYVRVDDQPARRIPWAQDIGIPGTATTDVSDQLPRLVGTRLDLEVWSGGEFARQVAAGHLEVGEGQSIQDVVGEPNLLTLSFDDGSLGQKSLAHEDATLGFEWVSESSRVGKVVWQVTTKDPGARNLSLSPDGLLASGVSTSSAGEGQRARGTFSVDTAKIPGHEEVSGASGPAPGAGGVVLATSPVSAATLASTSSSAYAAKPAKAPGTASILLQGYVTPPAAGETVFVRVLALPDETGVTAVSSPRRIGLPTVEDSTQGDVVELKVDEVVADLGRAPNPALVSCARVTVPWSANENLGSSAAWPPSPEAQQAAAKYGPNAAFVKAFYAQSGTYCPGDWPPPDDCDSIFCDVVDGLISIGQAIVDFATQLYTLVAYAYNGVIDTVVTLVAKGPLCQLLGAADKTAGDGCEAVVGAAARAAISAVLASFGLPPSLPTVEALEAIADGELDALAVELMKQAGVPCDSLAQDPDIVEAAAAAAGEAGVDPAYVEAGGDPCRAMARFLIDQVAGQVQQATSDSVAQASGLPSVLGVQGASMVPEPKGQVQPWTIRITASPVRKTADISELACRVELKQVGGTQKVLGTAYGALRPDGKGHLVGVVNHIPNVAADRLSNLTVTLKLRPYVTQCSFADKAFTASIKPFQNR